MAIEKHELERRPETKYGYGDYPYIENVLYCTCGRRVDNKTWIEHRLTVLFDERNELLEKNQ